MKKFRRLVQKILIESTLIDENTTINKVLADTFTYKLVQVNNTYRIINSSRFHRKTVPYIEISKEKAEKYLKYLNSWRGKPNGNETRTKLKANFNIECDEMFHNRNVDIYLDDEDDY